MKNPKYMKIDELHDYVISLPMAQRAMDCGNALYNLLKDE